MNDTEREDLVVQLKRAVKAKKPYYFWFCPKGEDGLPILLVSKKQAPLLKAGRAQRKTAQVKLSAEGTVHRSADGLVFQNTSKMDGGKVERAFKTKLATDELLKKVAPHLRKARVVTAEEFAAMDLGDPDAYSDGEAPVDATDLGAVYKLRSGEVRDMLAGAREVLGADHPKVKALAGDQKPAVDAHEGGDDAEAIRLLEALIYQGTEAIQQASEAAWNTRLEATKLAFQEARARGGESHPVIVGVPETRKAAFAKKNASEYLAAFDLLDEIVNACAAVGVEVEEDESEGEELADDAEDEEDDLDEDEDEDENDEEEESELDVEAIERADRALIAAEARWDALDNPEELDEWFDRAGELLDQGRGAEALAVVESEIHWRLERAERNKQVAEEIGEGRVQLAKAAILWRGAQADAKMELGRFVRSVLADPDVKDDPRYELIATRLAELDALIPDLGDKLASALDTVASASGTAREEAVSAAADLVDGYKRALDGVRPKLASVSENPLGSFAVLSTLDDALDRLADALAA